MSQNQGITMEQQMKELRLALRDLGRDRRLNCFPASWRTMEAQAGPSPYPSPAQPIDERG